MSDSSQSQGPGLLANILAVAGFIILIVIILWGAYHLLRLTGSGVSSLFSSWGSGESITVTVPREAVKSGTAFPVSWKYSPDEDGTYALLYQCKSNFRFEMTSASGKNNAITCGSAFTLGTTTNVTLIPVSGSTSTVDVPLSIVFMPAATSSATRPQGGATVHVSAGDTNTQPTTPAPTTTTTPRPTQPVGKPDLSVRILAVGVINPVSGAFESRYPSGPNDIAAVQFDIANNGGSATGAYYFTANLPLQGGYVYSSPIQSSLTPGSHVVNTLRFKPVQSNGGTITITVDSSYAVGESNEGNNTAAMFVSVPVWTGSYAPYVY